MEIIDDKIYTMPELLAFLKEASEKGVNPFPFKNRNTIKKYIKNGNLPAHTSSSPGKLNRYWFIGKEIKEWRDNLTIVRSKKQ